MIPPAGIAFAPPIVRTDAVVAGGNDVPVSVRVFPVETLVGLTVIAPLGTVTLIVFVLLLEESLCMSPALSVTVI